LSVTLQPVQVATRTKTESGQLVFVNDRLAAVLVCLPEGYGEQAGLWFLEAGFGFLAGPDHPTFSSMTEAVTWIERQLA
jgi:hypothetical protein